MHKHQESAADGPLDLHFLHIRKGVFLYGPLTSYGLRFRGECLTPLEKVNLPRNRLGNQNENPFLTEHQVSEREL